MVKVESINWLSREAQEAEVIISDGKFSLLCFAHPLRANIGEGIKSMIYALDADQVIRLVMPSFKAVKLSGPFDYHIEGMLLDKDSGTVKLGDVLIELGPGPIPGDVMDNEFLSCYCSRLDI